MRSECKILVGNHVGDLAIDIGTILKQISVKCEFGVSETDLE